MKIGTPGNKRYIEEITEAVFKKYDEHLITRRQAIEILSSWEVAITTENQLSWPCSISEKKYEPVNVVKFKLKDDVFGEYDGNDPLEKWKHISEGIEENYVPFDTIKNDDDVADTKYSNILKKVEENTKQEWGSEAAIEHRRQVYAKAEELAKQAYEKAITDSLNEKEIK